MPVVFDYQLAKRSLLQRALMVYEHRSLPMLLAPELSPLPLPLPLYCYCNRRCLFSCKMIDWRAPKKRSSLMWAELKLALIKYLVVVFSVHLMHRSVS